MKPAALFTLLFGLLACFGWTWVPAHLQADTWNAMSAAFTVLLLGALTVLLSEHEEMVVVLLYLAGVKAITAGCSLMWILDPWPVVTGQAQCDGGTGGPVFLLSLFVGLMVAIGIWSKQDGKNPRP